jgi:P4 family phage/plasmid primase-like protien
MSVVEFCTTTVYDLFQTWTEEIDNNAAELSSTYIVYAGENSAYVYFPTFVAANAVHSLHDAATAAVYPVYCSPSVDMSITTLAEFAGVLDAPYSWNAIEDISLDDVASALFWAVSDVVLYNHTDTEIQSMCKFVNLALPGSDTVALLSYIKHAVVTRGYADMTMDNDVQPMRYTILEARSEMKRCNPTLYAIYKERLVNEMLMSVKADSRSKSEMEHKVSGLAFELLFDSAVNCMGVMWCFTEGIWQECSSDGYIWNFLTSDFIEYLTSMDADTIALHLMSVNIRSRMMKDIKMRLQNDNFYELLDSKRNIIRMENGVYDTTRETLSDPVPSDYASVTSGVPYQVFDEQSHEVSRLMIILSSIFPDPAVLDFFMLSCSTFLEGYNSPKVFYIWWGMGNNAKSMVQTLVMKTFGEYCSTAPTSLVTGKRTESSGATPDLCHVEKKLVVFLQEPNPEEKIKAGKMKEMTGNDSMYVRQLFKSGKTMVLKAKIVIVCNNIIEIPGMDAAIRRRIVVVPFSSTFLDPAEYASRMAKGTLEPNSQTIDLSVEKELMKYKAAFMYLLCRKYSEWVDGGMTLKMPSVIKAVTEEYITRNNYVLRFIKNFVHPLRGSSVAATEMYEMYKEWFKRSYPGKKVQDFEMFTKEVSDEGYRDDGNGIIHDAFVSYNGEL